MKPEEKTTNKAIKLTESLGPAKMLILYAGCVLFGLIILIFTYRPLMIELHNAANKLHEVQTELLNQRNAITASDNSNVIGELIRQDDFPLAIAELTEKGRSLGLRFSSIAPQQLQEISCDSVQKQPINFTTESEYKNAGQFMAYVEEFSRSIVEVESLSICPSENDSTKLNVKLVLNLYVEI